MALCAPIRVTAIAAAAFANSTASIKERPSDKETLKAPEKLSPEINSLHNDKYENQLLRIFDFTAWIEAKILKEKLSDVLARHSEVKKYHSK